MYLDRVLVVVTNYLLAILYFSVSLSYAKPNDNYEPSPYYATIESATNPDWMSKLPDNISLSDLSIPGTHESMAFFGNLPGEPDTPNTRSDDITKLQQLFDKNPLNSLAKQLVAGIRAIDIRVKYTYSDDKNDPIPKPQLTIHHGAIYQHANLYDVIHVAYTFLAANRRETILMRLKLEDGSQWEKDHFAEIFTKYRDTKLYGKVFYGPSVSGYPQIDIPKLGDVRGKVVLTRLIGVQGGTYYYYGIKPSLMNIQDTYEVGVNDASNQKYEIVKKHFEATKDPANRDKLMINYVSATSLTLGFIPSIGVNSPSSIAHDTNERVWTYLTFNYDGPRTGVVMMDYPGWKLINKIISFNEKYYK